MVHLSVDAEHAELLRRQGAWEIVVAAMQKLPNEERLQMSGCRLLAAMAYDGQGPIHLEDPVACQVRDDRVPGS